MPHQSDHGLSRRHFLQGVGAGVAGLTVLDPRLAVSLMIAGEEAGPVGGVRRMGGNENPIGPSPKAIDAVSAQLKGLNWYPYQPDLPLAIHRFHNIPVDTSEGTGWAGLNTTFISDSKVVTGIGSTEVLRAAAWAYLLDGGHLVQANPSYEEIAGAGNKLGERVSVSRVSLTGDHRVNLEEMKRAVTPETRIISLCNPNNPTGTLLSHADLAAFAGEIDPRVLIVIDEAYIHFVRDPGYQDAISLSLSRPNVLVTRTFSKAYGIAGLRVGYGVAHPDVIRKISSYTLGPLGMHSNSIAGAVAALADVEHLQESRMVNSTGRDFLVREMSAMGWKPIDGECNFVLADTSADAGPLFEHLLSRNILTTSGSRWDMPTFIRVSVGLPEDNEAFIAAAKEL